MPKNEAIRLLVDSREKRPLLFPERIVVQDWDSGALVPARGVVHVEVVRATLPNGDYAIEGYEALVGVERKAGLAEELCCNILGRDRARFLNALSRFAENCQFPYLLIESMPETWWRSAESEEPDVSAAADFILWLVARWNLRLLWGGRGASSVTARRRLGELALRIMWRHVRADIRNRPSINPPETSRG